MTETDFNQLLDRYNQGGCTREEKQQLERWMDNIPEGASPFKSEAERIKIKQSLLSVIYAKAGIKEGKARTLSAPAFLKVAASIALLIVVAYGIWTIGFDKIGKNEITEVTATGGIQKIMLSDSTIVWLKPGSKLSYPQQFIGREREVTLTGGALFEVAKDPAKPFIMKYEDLTARVVGTSFNINPTATGIEVLVLTGKVIVSAKNSANTLTVLPNEKALFIRATSTLAKVEPAKEEIAQSVKGTQYSMVFESAKMKEVIERIESKFSVKVTVNDTTINNCPLTADFTDQSLGRTMKLIAQTLNFTYEIKADTVTITGTGCH